MSQTASFLHHAHKNHSLRFNSIIEKLAYLAGIANPIGTFPQLYQIWMNKDAAGVSLFTWTSFLVISMIMALYGILHHEKPLIMMYSSLIVVNLLIVIGILIY